MFPRLSQLDSANVGLANSKTIGNFLLGQSGYTNPFNIFLGKNSIPLVFTFWTSRAMSSFFKHVLSVVFRSSKPQVIRIHARRIIAMMQYPQSFWNPFFGMNHPRNTRGNIHLPSVMNSKLSLSSLIGGCCPKPTFFFRSNFYFVPETFLKLFVKHSAHVAYSMVKIQALFLLGARE